MSMEEPKLFYSWLKGKRILVIWTDKAHALGADWISFRVLDCGVDGLWLQGLDGPCGAKHDGSKVFANKIDIREIHEWKEVA